MHRRKFDFSDWIAQWHDQQHSLLRLTENKNSVYLWSRFFSFVFSRIISKISQFDLFLWLSRFIPMLWLKLFFSRLMHKISKYFLLKITKKALLLLRSVGNINANRNERKFKWFLMLAELLWVEFGFVRAYFFPHFGFVYFQSNTNSSVGDAAAQCIGQNTVIN